MQGRDAGSDAGDPIEVLRHELAHLALHEALGDLPPRWFDEGYASYAANEVARDAILGANIALLFRGMPPLDSLDARIRRRVTARARARYALAYRAVAELAARDPERGLTLFFRYWKETRSLRRARCAARTVSRKAQFEEIWRSRTRRRYGGLALVADLSIAAAVTLFIVHAVLRRSRRRRDRLRMAALVRADEEAERRETSEHHRGAAPKHSIAAARVPGDHRRRAHRLTSPRVRRRAIATGVRGRARAPRSLQRLGSSRLIRLARFHAC